MAKAKDEETATDSADVESLIATYADDLAATAEVGREVRSSLEGVAAQLTAAAARTTAVTPGTAGAVAATAGTDIERLANDARRLLQLIPEIQELIDKKKKGTKLRDLLIVALILQLTIWERWARISREKVVELGDFIKPLIEEVDAKMVALKKQAEKVAQLLADGKNDEAEQEVVKYRDAANAASGQIDTIKTTNQVLKAAKKKSEEGD